MSSYCWWFRNPIPNHRWDGVKKKRGKSWNFNYLYLNWWSSDFWIYPKQPPVGCKKTVNNGINYQPQQYSSCDSYWPLGSYHRILLQGAADAVLWWRKDLVFFGVLPATNVLKDFSRCQGEKNSQIMVDNSKLRKWTCFFGCFFGFLLIFLRHFWEITVFPKFNNKNIKTSLQQLPLTTDPSSWWSYTRRPTYDEKGSILVFLPCDMLAEDYFLGYLRDTLQPCTLSILIRC